MRSTLFFYLGPFIFNNNQKMTRLLTILFVTFVSFLNAQNPLWMRYPSISPDGNKIAFAYKGDIYIVSSKGGEAHQLTTHQEHDYMPVWSSDSKELAFASNRYGNFDVFIMPAEGGKATRLTFNSNNDFPYSYDQNGDILFSSTRMDDPNNSQFPYSRLPELYTVNKKRVLQQVLTTPAEDARWNKDQSKLIYHDKKGYEDQWRKHHTSSITRDIWIYDANTKEHTKISDFKGEDRTPIWSDDENSIFFLSEASGSFNIWKQNLKDGSKKQITNYDKHPVRFLSKATNGTLSYGYDGEIYTVKENEQPIKVNVIIRSDDNYNKITYKSVANEVSEAVLSPNGKELAFIARGEVFVTSIDYKETKRITNTPEQERSVSFSPDGNTILFAGERNDSWNIYQVKKRVDTEKYFYTSTILEEEVVLATDKETFQPSYSPDGKEIAFYEERTEIRIINLASKKVRTVLPAKYNYSYSDGDQNFTWSPDSKWLLAQYLPYDRWNKDIALVSADGKKVINLTESGYECFRPKWIMDGAAVMWFSNRNGMRSHGSWGSQSDAYAMFLTEEAYNQFQLTKGEFELMKEAEKEEKSEDKDSKKKSDTDKSKEEIKPLKFDLEEAKDRVVRLTIHSSSLSDAVLTKDGDKLFYLSSFEKGYDLWMQDFKKKETKLITKLGVGRGALILSKDESSLFVLSNKSIKKVTVKGGSVKPIQYTAEMQFDMVGEYEYMFDHAWRQTLKKFYVEDMHGVDWKFYGDAYRKFLPHINNGFDFAEILSELLGELNASHTGGRYFGRPDNGDKTGSLAIYPDYNYQGKGVKIKAILDKSELVSKPEKSKIGDVITKINGTEVQHLSHFYELMNQTEGKKLLVTIQGIDGKTKDIYVKPIGAYALSNLLYERWVKGREEAVKQLSGGKIGYVHVKGMNDESFREVYSTALGKYCDADALIVDTRFNGGGWLHDDLATFLSGKDYAEFVPRGQHIGHEPLEKWYKPHCVIVGEGNYSDAHGFPFAYRALGLGKIIGMPIPGTMTAVWWETLINSDIVFGIPQVGMMDKEGKLQENYQLEPDVKIKNDYKSVTEGIDLQLEEAVKLMMK